MQKILIVDDDITLRAALTRYLKDRGFLVHSATSGVEGFESFIQDPPDLIVSDVVMPEMDGFELCARVRESGTGRLIPFIFLSGRCDLEDRIQGHSIGADDYLVKPFHPRELIAKIEAQLARAGRIHSEITRALKQPSDELASAQPQVPLPLTPAEEKVFWEVIQGFTNKKIGDRLFLSPRTVQTHLSNILSKLSLENRSQLIRYAFENGYQPPRSMSAIENEEATPTAEEATPTAEEATPTAEEATPTASATTATVRTTTVRTTATIATANQYSTASRRNGRQIP
jgi:DNA-binding NarL/FixJ family response regulator